MLKHKTLGAASCSLGRKDFVVEGWVALSTSSYSILGYVLCGLLLLPIVLTRTFLRR